MKTQPAILFVVILQKPIDLTLKEEKTVKAENSVFQYVASLKTLKFQLIVY